MKDFTTAYYPVFTDEALFPVQETHYTRSCMTPEVMRAAIFLSLSDFPTYRVQSSAAKDGLPNAFKASRQAFCLQPIRIRLSTNKHLASTPLGTLTRHLE